MIFTSSASSVREGMSSVLFVCLVRQINRTDDVPSLTPLAQLMNITSLLTVCLSPGLLYGKSDQPISLKLGSYDWATGESERKMTSLFGWPLVSVRIQESLGERLIRKM